MSTIFLIEKHDFSFFLQKVFPLPTSMNQLLWDFGALDESAEADYVKALLDQFAEENSIFERLVKQEVTLTQLSEWVTSSQKLIREITGNIASVSQRDFQRVFKLISFFFLKKKQVYQLIEEGKIDRPSRFFKPNDSEVLEESATLAIAMAYYLRLPSTQKSPKDTFKSIKPREIFEEFMDKQLESSKQERKFKRILEDEMNFYVDQMRLPGSIAKNEALRENIFAIVVCVATK